eukprot:gene8560-7812_t
MDGAELDGTCGILTALRCTPVLITVVDAAGDGAALALRACCKALYSAVLPGGVPWVSLWMHMKGDMDPQAVLTVPRGPGLGKRPPLAEVDRTSVVFGRALALCGSDDAVGESGSGSTVVEDGTLCGSLRDQDTTRD